MNYLVFSSLLFFFFFIFFVACATGFANSAHRLFRRSGTHVCASDSNGMPFVVLKSARTRCALKIRFCIVCSTDQLSLDWNSTTIKSSFECDIEIWNTFAAVSTRVPKFFFFLFLVCRRALSQMLPIRSNEMMKTAASCKWKRYFLNLSHLCGNTLLVLLLRLLLYIRLETTKRSKKKK